VIAAYGGPPPPAHLLQDGLSEVWKAEGGAWGGEPPYVSEEDLDALPDDPQELLEHIHRVRQGQSASTEEQVMVFITDMLRSGLVPAEQRAVLYQTLMLVPGVDVTAGTAVLDGRTGVAIGRWEAQREERQEIIIDPDTGAFIGERFILTADMDTVPAGAVSMSAAVTTTVVDTVPAQVKEAATEEIA
jgi:hypothetical protein